MTFTLLLGLALIACVHGQYGGTLTLETHPPLTWQKCTMADGCVTQLSGKIVLDSNWRWIHSKGGFLDCYVGNSWNPSLCPDPQSCAKNCELEGADYKYTQGISTSGNSLTLKFLTRGDTGTNFGARVFLLSDDSTYQMFKLKNQEFTFDVDVSNLPCGLNGALYFSEMVADGGMFKYPSNKAGAKYGTGYCDARCPKIKFISGEGNILNWTPSPTDPNAGTGQYGSCCNEMDVWEANSFSAAYTLHPCTTSGQTRCSGSDCSSGYCDSDGCDFNSYRLGNKTFCGHGYTVDTTRKITVVTQFITADGTATSLLSEIRRIYLQNGKVIQNSKTIIPSIAPYDSITEPFCAAQKAVFGDDNTFAMKGGFTSLDKAFDNGMVLVMSIRDDPATNMLWLDGNYPPSSDPSKPGVLRGACSPSSGNIEVVGEEATVTFSNIRFGSIGSTVGGI